jgi:myo-inositol-1(or 4)-monophosphatase
MNLIQIQNQTIDIVKAVAQFIKQEIGKIQDGNIETKSLNSLVTYVDKQAEILLVEKLKTILPQASFLTEENTISNTNNEWQWIIDPLDGTTNFIHQVPIFAISVALAFNNEIQIGVVFEINQEECFYATINNGAFLNGNKITVSNTKKISDSLIATGFPYYDFEHIQNYLSFFKYLIENTRGIRRLGAASVDLCYVACGRFDAFFEYSLAPWDVAAGSLIVKEAGGSVYDFSGKENYIYGKEIVACNPNISLTFLNKIYTYFKNNIN